MSLQQARMTGSKHRASARMPWRVTDGQTHPVEVTRIEHAFPTRSQRDTQRTLADLEADVPGTLAYAYERGSA